MITSPEVWSAPYARALIKPVARKCQVRLLISSLSGPINNKRRETGPRLWALFTFYLMFIKVFAISLAFYRFLVPLFQN